MNVPAKTQVSFKRGDKGTGVVAIQSALNSMAIFVNLTEDGIYGAQTEGCVKTFQDLRHITADGICGPQTQRHIAHRLIGAINESLPEGLLASIVDGESGALIAAVNWSVPGGVDCGYVQRRVSGPPFDDSAVKRAFWSLYQLKLLATALRERHDTFIGRPAVVSHEKAFRLATLAHNYPAGADRLSRTLVKDLSAYWTSSQAWVVSIGAKFPDGTPIKTPLQWCEHYSLGNEAHDEPGMMVRLVQTWT